MRLLKRRTDAGQYPSVPPPLTRPDDPCPYCAAAGVRHMHGAITYGCGTFVSCFGIRMSDLCQSRQGL
jgi:hypothetical protein